MALLFVAHSKVIAAWGGDVGLGKNLYLLDLADDLAAAEAALAAKPCGAEDWKILKREEVTRDDVAALQAKLALKEKRVDPALYPRLRGFAGLFKVKPENVENHLLVKTALEGLQNIAIKIKPTDIAAYLLHNALK
jgi:hypothetical protein